ncbi:Hsp70 family protein [Corynebacterium hindlerae]|uniref:Hsp70 family protein n=1 Tax=Corynebacterium hindlerae TaxID=699041 RepID=UPI001AD6BA35|nr:Hsp70 family protein [Corynebacterium hindlerae]QTH59410.1 Hsp70 family protein [Corynebacterium hindlerae]
MNGSWHLAIDFGTSNTSAAHTAPLSGNIETVSLTHRSNLLPSAVYLEGDTVAVGETALMQGRKNPAQVMLSPKRYIDHDTVQLGGREVSELDLVGAVLKHAIDKTKAQHKGTDPATVTLTHPEAWSAHSLGQLLAAAKKAGLDDATIRTISEPRAAAIHYAAQQNIPAGKHVAVFDFGGGTLDIAVLQAQEDGNFRVVAAKGDNSLGGRTVDNLMYRWVISQLEFDDPDFADYVKTAPVSVMHALEASVREAKEVLSDTSSATISVSTPQGEQDILLTRDEFNTIIEGVVTRAVELTRAALDQAGVSASDTPLYLTGGSSRIPYVHQRLNEVGMVERLDDPKTVVSRGALRATLRGFSDGGSAPDMQQFSATPGANTNPYANPDTNANPYANPPRQQPQPAMAQGSMMNFSKLGAGTASSGGKKKLLLGGVAAVAILALAGFIVPKVVGGGEPEFQLTPQMNERHLARTEPETIDILPASFLEKLNSCNKPSDSYSRIDWAKDKQSRSCKFVEDLPDAPGSSDLYTGYFEIFSDDVAKEVYEASQNAEGDRKLAQKAKGKQPEIAVIQDDRRSAIVVWYEKDNYLLLFDNYGKPTDIEVTQWAQYFGFMK